MAVILCADDYAISQAVSDGIAELATAGRISATSAMVTFPEWPRLAKPLAALRGRVAVGLHLNLTVGAPLAAMPSLAPGGILPGIGSLTLRAGRGAVSSAEIAAEVTRQYQRFTDATGFAPDFIDGHQHVHVLPGIRAGVLAAVRLAVSRRHEVLIRDPADSVPRILARRSSVPKALQVAALAMGFARAARAAGLPVNMGFSGFSPFNTAQPYTRELESAFTALGPRHMVMCHPGHVDEALEARDSVTVRREQEFRALMSAEGLPARLWRPDRAQAKIWDAGNG